MMCRQEALALAPPGARLLVNGRAVRSTGRVHRFVVRSTGRVHRLGSGWVVSVIGAPPGYALCPLDDTVPAPPMPWPEGDEGDTLTDAPEVEDEGGDDPAPNLP